MDPDTPDLNRHDRFIQHFPCQRRQPVQNHLEAATGRQRIWKAGYDDSGMRRRILQHVAEAQVARQDGLAILLGISEDLFIRNSSESDFVNMLSLITRLPKPYCQLSGEILIDEEALERCRRSRHYWLDTT